MDRPKICLTLTGSTLEQDIEILNKYRDYVDMVELRADFLGSDERLEIRRFPKMAGIPCILTIRRTMDGGMFKEGEAARTMLFARALAFAKSDAANNFQYVDFEEDYHVPSLQDAALAFGTHIIRSVHDMQKPITNIIQRLEGLNATGYEIPKIAFRPKSLNDVTYLFQEASKLHDNNHILVAMGDLGVSTRILSAKLKNYLTYVSSEEAGKKLPKLAHIDPKAIVELYNFRSIDEHTQVFGVTGWPLTSTSSPTLHNEGYRMHNMNAVYIPLKAEHIEEAISFANVIGIKGLSVTVPHKEKVLKYVSSCDKKVEEIGASNTIVKQDGKWCAYNTDVSGFSRSLLEFTGTKNLRGWNVAIIGAGGAAKAIAYAVKKLHGNACVFNRTVVKAKELAETYGFKYSTLGFGLGPDTYKILRKYSDLIIQTTSVGMNSDSPSTQDNDPLYFYNFTGKEMVFDIVYMPAVTPVLQRAADAGCKVCNGFDMLKYQGYEQFELYTGEKYEIND